MFQLSDVIVFIKTGSQLASSQLDVRTSMLPLSDRISITVDVYSLCLSDGRKTSLYSLFFELICSMAGIQGYVMDL
jgi:hypothetical protein